MYAWESKHIILPNSNQYTMLIRQAVCNPTPQGFQLRFNHVDTMLALSASNFVYLHSQIETLKRPN